MTDARGSRTQDPRPRTQDVWFLLVLAFAAACGREPELPAAPVLPPPTAPGLAVGEASRLARLSLACVDREWPNKPGHIYGGERDVRPPREPTPSFFGCFDWHSAVHGHWAMVRLLRRFPDLPEAPAIRAVLDRHLAPEPLARELAFFQEERSRTFERPYGWAWLLRLHAELAAWDHPDAKRWGAALDPFARFLAGRTTGYLSRLSSPVREGVHPNTAFALAHARDWAVAVGDAATRDAIDAAARAFYLGDRACPLAYEPSGEDFLSPCLAEADLMRRVLLPGEFRPWLAGFLPGPGTDGFQRLAQAVEVKDPADPRIGHLIGLAFHRSWCLEGIADALPPGDGLAELLRGAATLQRAAGFRQMDASGYGGEHWLGSFVVHLMTATGREAGR